ncbi:hypothetical protein BDZ45DRAFT_667502 [Acephala macrosclerotiorum]|nr:hypothetical protein BDZ45DRAFT_667502 [Acephala macrosclerotiorum]
MYGKESISVQQVLQGLGKFSYNAPNEDCPMCSQDFAASMGMATRMVQNNFGGLCLDCIDKAEKRDHDVDYKHHHQWSRVWDMGGTGCRFEHSQPSWYFSWMARKQAADFFERERDARKRKAS